MSVSPAAATETVGSREEKEEQEEQKTAARETNGVQMSFPAVASC